MAGVKRNCWGLYIMEAAHFHIPETVASISGTDTTCCKYVHSKCQLARTVIPRVWKLAHTYRGHTEYVYEVQPSLTHGSVHKSQQRMHSRGQCQFNVRQYIRKKLGTSLLNLLFTSRIKPHPSKVSKCIHEAHTMDYEVPVFTT